MIPLQDQEYLRRYFAEGLTGGVKVDYFAQRTLAIVVPGRETCRYCSEVQQLWEELHALSPKIQVRVHDLDRAKAEAARQGIERVPATVLRGPLNRPLTLFGFPSGGLFPPLVALLRDISRGTTALEARLRRRVQRLRDDLSVRLFVTPGCPYSPAMLQSLCHFALEQRRLKVSIIEIEEFPRLIDLYRIEAVPFTLIGERARFAGAVSEQELLDQILLVAEGRPLALHEGLFGSGGRPSTPLAPPDNRGVQQTRGGLIIPGR